MFTLEYKDSQEVGFPPHGSTISYYSLKDLPGLRQSLEPIVNTIQYAWFSSCGEVNEHYDSAKHAEYKIGDSKKSEFFQDSDRESHKTVFLTFHLDNRENYPHGTDKEEFPRIAWEYTHNIRRQVAEYQGDKYLPCFDINYLLRSGVIRPVIPTVNKALVGEEGNQYFQVHMLCIYKKELFMVKAAQDEKWPEDAWTKEALERGEFGEVDVFGYDHLSSIDNKTINDLLIG